MTGGPLEIDPTLDWVRTCDRPPVSFLHGLAARRGTAMLADLVPPGRVFRAGLTVRATAA